MSKRFKLLFLSEHEQYLTDVGCSVDVRKIQGGAALPANVPVSIIRLLKSGGFRGRLRIGSSSLFLDLESIVCINASHSTSMVAIGRLYQNPAYIYFKDRYCGIRVCSD